MEDEQAHELYKLILKWTSDNLKAEVDVKDVTDQLAVGIACSVKFYASFIHRHSEEKVPVDKFVEEFFEYTKQNADLVDVNTNPIN